MKKNQRGFGLVEVIIILIILALLIAVALIAYNNFNRKSVNKAASPPSASQDLQQQTTTTKTYTNSSYGYSFTYPNEWKTSDAASTEGTTPGQPDRYSLTIESPDLQTANDGIGFHLTKGSRMYVTTADTNATTPDQAIDESSFVKMTAEDRQAIKVAGYDAVQFNTGYEGSPYFSTYVLKDGKLYDIHFDYVDGSLAQDKAVYDATVQSFKFTN